MMAPSDPPLETALEGERVECEHADRCGGCPMIGLSYAEQLAQKRGRIVQSLSLYSSLALVYTEPVAPARPIVGYRTRAKLIVGPGGRVGLFAKAGGHEVVDIPRCRVLAPSIARVADRLRAMVAAVEASGGPLHPVEPSGQGWLRAVDLREVKDNGVARVLVTLVVDRARASQGLAGNAGQTFHDPGFGGRSSPPKPPNFNFRSPTQVEALKRLAEELMASAPAVVGVAVNFHDGETPQVLGRETVTLAGAASAPDRLGGSVHHATFGSFVQVHRGQAERVHALIMQALGGSTAPGRALRVVDLYGGSGSIALGLAATGATVRLVESFGPAVAQARHAAHAQNLDVQAECADVSSALRGMVERHETFDAVVVNPPRRGTSPTAREWIARLEPAVIAYVSCNPQTLARDLDHLARLGYRAAALSPLDMIPLTDEVETVAVLRQAAVPLPRVAYEDDEVLFVEKGPHEPTTPQGEYAGSLLARARCIRGAEKAVPIHRLDVGTSGIVMLAKSADYAARWAKVLTDATTRKIYIAGVRGVTPSKGTIARDLREEGKLWRARTRYRRLAVAAGHSVLRVLPDQGRTHQIRRHFAGIGHPVLGDGRYGHAQTNRHFEERNGLDRAFLHCVRIEFAHPGTGDRHVVEAPLPGDLRAVLERAGGPDMLRFLDHKSALGHPSSTPPDPSAQVVHGGSALDVDTASPSVRPDAVDDDDDGHPSERC